MQQKKIWMLFLIIGISLYGCATTDYVYPITYKFVNTFNEKIEMKVFTRNEQDFKYSKTILAKDSIEMSMDLFYTSNPFNTKCYDGDSVVIQFVNNKCVGYKGRLDLNGKENTGVFDISKYKADPYEKSKNKRESFLRYTIDSTDYNLAEPCK
ncbi:MAG: hypothetical protein KA327_09050 [Pseudarcicella sp.]|nr:hypothetical protein [Pseudarcicella sp.]